MEKTIVIILGILLLLPPSALIAVGLLVTPATTSCSVGSLAVAGIPDSLTVRTASGRSITLDRQQLSRAAAIITVGAQTVGVGRGGVAIALMAALTESSLRQLANSRAFPSSTAFPHDGDGSDHDSLGLFQMRPSTGWGTVEELMDPAYQARAFFGGPGGPNAGSPRGLLDIEGWRGLPAGVAAQSVEVSAYPDRYAEFAPVAEAILETLALRDDHAADGPATDIPETSRVVLPLAPGTYTLASPFGWRLDPFTGERQLHGGTDYAAASGSAILAVADGVVAFTGMTRDYGGLIIIESNVEGERVAAYYGHMWSEGMHVSTGEHVRASQHIGDVGSAGRSTGPHLHLEIRPGGASSPRVDADRWLREHGALGIDEGVASSSTCGGQR